MTQANAYLIQQLQQAREREFAVGRTLQAHIAASPPCAYRRMLGHELRATRRHAELLDEALSELGFGGIFASLREAAGNLATQLTELAPQIITLPLSLLSTAVTPGEDQLLHSAEEVFAVFSGEVAKYVALEQSARSAGNEQVRTLAAALRSEEERIVESLRDEIAVLARRAYARAAGRERGSSEVTASSIHAAREYAVSPTSPPAPRLDRAALPDRSVMLDEEQEAVRALMRLSRRRQLVEIEI